MVTTLPPLRVMTGVRCPRSAPRFSMLAPVASGTRSPFRASNQISACTPDRRIGAFGLSRRASGSAAQNCSFGARPGSRAGQGRVLFGGCPVRDAGACLDRGTGGDEPQEGVADRLPPAVTELEACPGEQDRLAGELPAARSAGLIECG